MQSEEITEDEEKIIENFLAKFMILQKNQEVATVNLALVMKAFPKVFTRQHTLKLEQLNFRKMQKILISFFNDDQDEMLTYYDNRMYRRLIALKKSSVKNFKMIERILEISKTLYESS